MQTQDSNRGPVQPLRNSNQSYAPRASRTAAAADLRRSAREMDAAAAQPETADRFRVVVDHDDADGEDHTYDLFFVEDTASGGRVEKRTRAQADSLAALYNRGGYAITRSGAPIATK